MVDTKQPSNAAKNAMAKPSATGTAVSTSKYATVSQMMKQYEPYFKQAIGDEIKTKQFMRTCLTYFNQTPALMECTQTSLIGALMTCAQLKMVPSPILGHVWLIPFKNNKKGGAMECQFILGYKGMIELFYRNQMSNALFPMTVYDDEKFEVYYGTESRIVHEPAKEYHKNRKAVAYYVTATIGYGLTSAKVFWVMTPDEAKDYAYHYSKAYRDDIANNRQCSPWSTAFDSMVLKTCMRQLFKWLPISIEMQTMIAQDETVKSITLEELDRGINIFEKESESPQVSMDERPAGASEPTIIEGESKPAPANDELAEAKKNMKEWINGLAIPEDASETFREKVLNCKTMAELDALEMDITKMLG